MTPRGFDRYMVRVGMGTHPKFARLTDAEFRAHIVGVLALAAAARERGCLLVGELEAEPIDVAAAAGVPEQVARSAMRKLEAIGVLYRDDELGCLRVHDWDDVNPAPRTDRTNAERQRRHRQRNGQSNGARNADSNGARNAADTAGNADVTPPEVEGEVTEGSLRSPSGPADSVTSIKVEELSSDSPLAQRLAEIRVNLNRMPGDRRKLTELDDVAIESALAAHPTVDPLQAARSAVARGRQNLNRTDAFLRELRTLETRAERTRPAAPAEGPKRCFHCKDVAVRHDRCERHAREFERRMGAAA